MYYCSDNPVGHYSCFTLVFILLFSQNQYIVRYYQDDIFQITLVILFGSVHFKFGINRIMW